MRRRVVIAAAAALVAAGCGTRLSDSAFERPATSPTPSASSSAGGTDVGVTGTTIRIGNIVSRTNFFDPRAFVGAYYGVKSYVDDVNRSGGINGRRLELVTCDDQGNASVNVECVRKLIDRDHVFALVGNAILSYGGAPLVQRAGVPDIGSQPVDNAYVQYSHLWDVVGESAPRNGTIGWNGVRYNGTEVYRWFKSHFRGVPLRAAVVSYNQSSSLAFGNAIATGLRVEGYRVTSLQVNFALPDFDSAAVAMKHARVNFVFDTMDRSGNERLCRSIDDNRLTLVAKVTTTQGWDANVRSDYAASPHCRNVIFATGDARSYDDREHPAVVTFREAMGREGWDEPATMSEWALQAWSGAMWFSDAVRSCGARVTRTCVETFMRRPGYAADGLLIPRSFAVQLPHPGMSRNCINVVRWSDAANGGAGGWVDQVADMTTNCALVPSLPFKP